MLAGVFLWCKVEFAMDRRKVRVGLLFSTTGPYATIGRAMLNGAKLAVEEVNADPSFAFSIEVNEANPGGRDADYAAAARRMLT